MNKIRKGDQVIVTTGRDKGKRGTVTQRVDEERLVVEGVHIAKKHVKPNQSNVAIYNAATGKADRVAVKLRTGKDGKPERFRVYKSSGEEIKA
jgi:large subunit ribosomal protein L24